ncbi:MAG: hypothetical protein IKJ88_07730 [Clostridia bacterium]|nr:hypothetical protein [Clostridia bacterium]
MLFGKKKITNEEITKALIDKSLEVIINQLPEKTFPSGIIYPYFVAFDIPATKNEAFLKIERTGSNVSLRVHVLRQGTDRSYSNFIYTCSDSELEGYLKNDVDRDELYKSVMHLSESADEYWK